MTYVSVPPVRPPQEQLSAEHSQVRALAGGSIHMRRYVRIPTTANRRLPCSN